MLARKFRLPNTEFAKFRGVASRPAFSSRYFFVRAAHNKLSHNRFGVIVGVNVSKKSTTRHALKRLAAEHINSWPNLRKDFIIVMSPSAAQASKKEIREAFAAARSAV